MIVTAKLATLVVWVFVVLNWISPIEGWSNLLLWTGVFLVVAHTIEMLVYLPAAKRVGGNVSLHALQLFVFGYAHNMQLIELEKQAEEK